ncbi:hypothetical protein DICVIV_00109 [Dictyocaulus viviparus]|uniref:CHK kinase-like domain-containing protein n=1 Tax=Dictyocaulus viviparus TaxID=29172 RepID=A0A0D8YAC6_DICVI|nr:hypothetical protein DICVIV_00109 [Dictyocaulus viviparus]
MSLGFTAEEKSEFTEKPFSELFGAVFQNESLENMIKLLGVLPNEKLSAMFKRVEKILPDLMDLDWADRLPDELGMKRVLCHGDLWSMNILWRSMDNSLDLAALIDYQTAHFGCPAIDLVRVLSACLSGRNRRDYWEELLKESYRQYFPMGGFMVIPLLGPLFDVISKTFDEETRNKSLEIIAEKTEYLVDDILHYHERNMERKKNKRESLDVKEKTADE